MLGWAWPTGFCFGLWAPRSLPSLQGLFCLMPKLENQTGMGKVRERLENHQRKCPLLSSSTRMEARRGSMDPGALEPSRTRMWGGCECGGS